LVWLGSGFLLAFTRSKMTFGSEDGNNEFGLLQSRRGGAAFVFFNILKRVPYIMMPPKILAARTVYRI
jgi:hypothetical protein